MDTNHGGGTLLWNHKKNHSVVLPKKRKTCSWEGDRGRERERKIVYFLVMINY
jgi:hypothetical protein